MTSPTPTPSRRPRILGLVALLLALAPRGLAQRGDAPGEEQPDLPADLVIPAAPVLSPDEALDAFALPPGFRIELVAAEPLVVDPIAMAFDEDGRIWVVEMRGYMPDLDATGEDAPVGEIAILSDTDGDGRMDERTVFMDELVLPRAIAVTRRGALVLAPPDLLFCRDDDGDGRADVREVVDTNLAGIVNPEHAINGLMPTNDNWFRCANAGVKYGFVDGAWTEAPTTGGGQWGIAKDDLGRVFYNTNSDPLRCDVVPTYYSLRNPNHGAISGINVKLAKDHSTWPARITPGVNRGYQERTLRDDFTLRTVTGACGPVIYRGAALGEDYQGDAFISEPCGNLVKRYVLEPQGSIGLRATNAWEGREFLTSTDERFRPVNLYDGPDGGLYVVDLYRGLIQHRTYVTTFLRKQVVARGLENPVGLGRIWRVVREDHEPWPQPKMSGATWTELVAALAHPNGWWRDTAQRLIVEEFDGDEFVVEMLRETIAENESWLGRMHALWTLHGIDELTEAVVAGALQDADARVQHTAVRVSEPWLGMSRSPVLDAVIALGGETTDARLRHQVLLSLGESVTEKADAALARLTFEDCSTGELRSAVLSGLRGRELAFLERLLARSEWDAAGDGREQMLHFLARCVVREGVNDQIARLLEVVAGRRAELAWQRDNLAAGMLAGRGKGPTGDLAPIRLGGEPGAYAMLEASEGKAGELASALAWPGKPGLPAELVIRELTDEETARFERGRETYAAVCAACHQPSGLGEPGKAPPLRGQKYVLGDPERLARILSQGLHGPIRVEGVEWDMEMPALVAPPEEIAALMTYIRREWGHGAEPVTTEQVVAVQEATRDRAKPWTIEELEAGGE